MSITYPLIPPSTPGATSVQWSATDAVATVSSAFTFSTQVQEWSGQLLTVNLNLPAMKRDVAEPWVAFLLALKGMWGTCLIGDMSYQGKRGVGTGTPLVNGLNLAMSQQLVTDGWTHSVTGILKAGDWISFNTGTTIRLHKILSDANSDGSGNATFDIYPCLRENVGDNTAIVLTKPVGTFRLASNTRGWSVDNAIHYGISASFVEAF